MIPGLTPMQDHPVEFNAVSVTLACDRGADPYAHGLVVQTVKLTLAFDLVALSPRAVDTDR